MLCRKCQDRFEKGLVSETDIEVSKAILKLSESIKSLRDITLKRAVRTPSMIVIVCEKGDAARIIGKEGLTVKKLEKALGKTIKIIEGGSGINEFIADLLHPLQVEAVNVVYKPEGEVLRVLTGRGPAGRIPADDYRSVILRVFRKDIEIRSA
jgi:transcription antitermination factor NusA-like protein